MPRAKTVVYAGAAIASWAGAYYYFAQNLDKSSSIVTQTLFNLGNQQESAKLFNLPVKVDSSIRGKMNQFKGFADINFDVSDKSGSNHRIIIRIIFSILDAFLINVKAHRQGLNWKTDSLTVTSASGQKVVFIE